MRMPRETFRDDLAEQPWLGQVVSPNHLVGKQHPKHGVDSAQEPVAEIRFFPRLHGIDMRGPKDVDARKPCHK